MLVGQVFKQMVRRGVLRVVDADGRTHVYGGAGPGPEVTIRLHDRKLHTSIALNPTLRVGEAYMDGTLTVDDGRLIDFLDLVGMNMAAFNSTPLQKLLTKIGYWTRPLQQFNAKRNSRRNVAHHYDLSDALYEMFLDRDRQYSCAYFLTDNDSLETAQRNKQRHIASKLLLEPGQRVLDIGCGWGGLALYLARTADVEVVGITLSKEQLAVAQRRAEEAGLADRVSFRLQDYREEKGTYDRIVSVGMFEHVGASYYDTFFGAMKRLLADNGVALLHAIGRMEPPGSTNPWLRKYIFPGGYCPALSETIAAVERTGLWITDVEILRLHYARTLREWRQRFMAGREEAKRLYDERFCRMWEFYLAGCEAAFRWWDQMVFQMQLAKRVDTVPITRDYMLDWERSAAAV